MSFSPETNTTHREIVYGDGRCFEVEVPDSEPSRVPEYEPYKVAADVSAARMRATEASIPDALDPLRHNEWEAKRRAREALLSYLALSS